jgi:predicted AAA+ superfamily ATPase
MNGIHSDPAAYRPRWLTAELRAAVRSHPVVVVTGARQVGKSTLLRHAEPFSAWRYRSLDHHETLDQARELPASLWAGINDIVLDEVQREPALLSAVKTAVDEDRRRRFVLSGSANLLLLKQVSESLAGRAVYLVLEPMTLGESLAQPWSGWLDAALAGDWAWRLRPPPTPVRDPLPYLLRGFMPALLGFDEPRDWLRWWEGYVATYLERDLRQLSQVDSLADFRQVMALLALRSGQLINQSEMARDARVSQPTVHRYLGLLESSHLFHRLSAWASSRTTRLLKSPRAFFDDPALAVFLAGYFDTASLRSSRELGGFFESLVYLHLRAAAQQLTPRAAIHFWRTQRGDEVDFVIEHGRRVLAIEVKLTEQPGFRHSAGLRQFLRDHPEAAGGLLVHTGTEVEQLDSNLFTIPWTHLAV